MHELLKSFDKASEWQHLKNQVKTRHEGRTNSLVMGGGIVIEYKSNVVLPRRFSNI